MNELKNKLLELLNSDSNIRYSYMALEKLIAIMLKDYIESQGKSFIFEHSHVVDKHYYDACAPEGFDQFVARVAGETARNNIEIIANKTNSV